MRSLHVSCVETFGDCPAAYDYRRNHRVDSAGYNSALTVGKAMHAAGQKMREGWAPMPQVALAAAAEVIDAAAKPRPEDAEQALIDAARVTVMIEGYWRRWSAEPIRTDRNELTLRAPLVNPATGKESKTFYVEGTLDGALEGPHVYEEKTTNDTLDETEAYLRNGLQIPIYQYLTLYSLGEPTGALIDLVKKPTVKRRTAQGESLLDWGKRCLEDYAKRPEHFFRRVELPYDEARMRWALSEFWRVAEEIRLSDKQGYRAIRSLKVCRGSTGWCRYRGLCWYSDLDGYDIEQQEEQANERASVG
jgi:hypothetical protein